MRLKWTLATKGMRPHRQWRAKLEEKIRKLEAHLEHFPVDAVHLQVHLEKHARKDWFTATMTLRLPSNLLRAQKRGFDPIPALDLGIKALLRELAVLKSELRHESQWSRQEGWPQQVARAPLTPAPTPFS